MHKNDDKLAFITPPCLSFASLLAKLKTEFLGNLIFLTLEEKKRSMDLGRLKTLEVRDFLKINIGICFWIQPLDRTGSIYLPKNSQINPLLIQMT
jgi:hypothetical protein